MYYRASCHDGNRLIRWNRKLVLICKKKKNKDFCKLNLRTNATAFRVWERAEKMRIKHSANSEKDIMLSYTFNSSTFSTKCRQSKM